MLWIAKEFFTRQFRFGSETGPLVTSGTGSPEGVVTAPVGSQYTRTDGGVGTTFYTKESGVGSTGWVARSTAYIFTGGTVAIAEVTIDFGSTGRQSIKQAVTVSGVTVGQKVLAAPSLNMPSGLSADELEMDMIAVAGAVTATDTVTLIASSVNGIVTGRRTIALTVI